MPPRPGDMRATAACDTHGLQPVKQVCAHLAPGERGTLVGVRDRSATVLVCADCLEAWTEDGAVPARLEPELAGLLRDWCAVCWSSRAPARLCRGSG